VDYRLAGQDQMKTSEISVYTFLIRITHCGIVQDSLNLNFCGSTISFKLEKVYEKEPVIIYACFDVRAYDWMWS